MVLRVQTNQTRLQKWASSLKSGGGSLLVPKFFRAIQIWFIEIVLLPGG